MTMFDAPRIVLPALSNGLPRSIPVVHLSAAIVICVDARVNTLLNELLRFQVAAVKVFCEITHPRRACMAVSPPALMPV
jgi:hypothetical protein